MAARRELDPAIASCRDVQTKVDIDVETLKSEIKKTYADVSTQPEKDFIFPTGRAWAENLDYPDELSRVPDTAVASLSHRMART